MGSETSIYILTAFVAGIIAHWFFINYAGTATPPAADGVLYDINQNHITLINICLKHMNRLLDSDAKSAMIHNYTAEVKALYQQSGGTFIQHKAERTYARGTK